MIQRERIRSLNSKSLRKGDFVLYWMQASQRAEYNHALEYAIAQANELRKPLVALFVLTGRYPEANLRHYHFLLEGMKETSTALEERGIQLVVKTNSPQLGVVDLSDNACLVVVDRGYLKLQRDWRSFAANHIECPLVQVESDVVVPIEEASSKEEYTAATIRPKIKKKLERFLVPLPEQTPKKNSLDLPFESFDIQDTEKALDNMDIDRGVKASEGFHGGTMQAKKLLGDFIEERLRDYAELRNDPSLEYLSNMSPYLHFGQISPIYIALEVSKAGGPGSEEYLEELIVRRELSMNFTLYNPGYDSLEGLPDWARKTLREHEIDSREHIYTLRELEEGRTHDDYWNAAQKEMVFTGKMHGYMRMYWGKKILEWSETPEKAHSAALYLNNKYELDGRDPNGFTGILWCFGKHDRAWKERDIFGKIRYMNDRGLKRKFDIDSYVRKVKDIVGEDRGKG
jgi:deoxyribodipyrimidine photo-lyase